MPKLKLLGGACALAFLLGACGGGGGGGDDGSGGSAVPGKVTTTNGFSDGTTARGGTVHVFANPSTATQVFDHWSGDTGGLADAASWHTTFTLGTSDVNLTAVFKTVTAWTPTETTINGEDFWYHVPASPKGIILFLHGTGGTGPQWFKDPEFLEYLRQAVARGYAVAGLTAADHVNKDWTLSPEDTSNPDLRNAQQAFNGLISAGLIGTATPRFTIGFSNGAGFAMLFCDFFGCQAQEAVSAQGGPPSLIASTSVPTRFVMNQNDTQGLVDNDQAQDFSDSIKGRGVPSEVEIHTPSPVYPQRFARVPGLTAADSLAIWQALHDHGFLDANDFLTDDPYLDASGWQAVIPSQYTDVFTLFYISEEMDNAWTAHGFWSEHFPRTMRFFEAG